MGWGAELGGKGGGGGDSREVGLEGGGERARGRRRGKRGGGKVAGEVGSEGAGEMGEGGGPAE